MRKANDDGEIVAGSAITCSSSVKFATTLYRRLLFLGPNLGIVLHAHTSICSTGIHKIKRSSILLIHNRFATFNLPASNIELRQGHVNDATKCQQDRASRSVGFSRYISPGLQ
jgi:hypothetical protein